MVARRARSYYLCCALLMSPFIGTIFERSSALDMPNQARMVLMSDARTEKMRSRCVPNAMRAHAFVCERRHSIQHSLGVPFDHCMNSKARDGFTTPVQEHVIGRWTASGQR
jgi:hypothetical protein